MRRSSGARRHRELSSSPSRGEFRGPVDFFPPLMTCPGDRAERRGQSDGTTVAQSAHMITMTTREHSRGLVIIGLILMAVGVVDPLEGSLVILGGSVLIVLGTGLSGISLLCAPYPLGWIPGLVGGARALRTHRSEHA